MAIIWVHLLYLLFIIMGTVAKLYVNLLLFYLYLHQFLKNQHSLVIISYHIYFQFIVIINYLSSKVTTIISHCP